MLMVTLISASLADNSMESPVSKTNLPVSKPRESFASIACRLHQFSGCTTPLVRESNSMCCCI